MKRIGLTALLGWIVLPVVACPVCADPAGAELRAAIFNDQFFRNAALTLTPFAAFAVLVGLAFYYPRPFAPPSHENPE